MLPTKLISCAKSLHSSGVGLWSAFVEDGTPASTEDEVLELDLKVLVEDPSTPPVVVEERAAAIALSNSSEASFEALRRVVTVRTVAR